MFLAARHGVGETHITTVDLRDVNDDVEKPWVAYKAKQSPRQMFASLNAPDAVRFAIGNSLDVLKELEGPFNFVFLDGSHERDVVAGELRLVLPKLAPDGLILLHDFFPNAQPIWEGQFHCDGPYAAVEDLRAEGAAIKALPLGDLPWPTKLGGNKTSLALVVADA